MTNMEAAKKLRSHMLCNRMASGLMRDTFEYVISVLEETGDECHDPERIKELERKVEEQDKLIRQLMNRCKVMTDGAMHCFCGAKNMCQNYDEKEANKFKEEIDQLCK